MAVLKNARHEKFAQALAKGKTADESYREAGFRPNRGNAVRLKTNERIRERVAEIQSKGADRSEITIARTLQELGRLGFSDLRHAFTEEGNLKAPSAWGDDLAAAISSIKVVTRASGAVDEDGNKQVEHIHEIKLWDKNSALEKIAKHLGMLVDRSENVNTNYTISADPLSEEEWIAEHGDPAD